MRRARLNAILEYITAVRSFAPQDVTFNGVGAFIRAAHVEIDLTTHIHNKPLLFGFAYGQTWQALAFNLPKSSYAVVINTPLWKNTSLGLEYRHDINYGKTALSSIIGAGLPVPHHQYWRHQEHGDTPIWRLFLNKFPIKNVSTASLGGCGFLIDGLIHDMTEKIIFRFD